MRPKHEPNASAHNVYCHVTQNTVYDMTDNQITYTDLLEEYKKADLIPYNELLKTNEWKEKREEILKRDSKICQICNRKETEKFEIERIQDILKSKESKLKWKIVGKNKTILENIKSGNYWFFSPAIFKKSKAYNGLKYLITPTPFVLIQATKPYILHVHHKKYILNILPWENYDEDYITICNWCHLEVHKINEIEAFRLINNKLIQANMTPCKRCFGKGWIEKYEHIENGLCFRCLGKRFEELIEYCLFLPC